MLSARVRLKNQLSVNVIEVVHIVLSDSNCMPPNFLVNVILSSFFESNSLCKLMVQKSLHNVVYVILTLLNARLWLKNC